MKIHLQGCPIPIIWLDTSVIIDLTKYRAKVELNILQQERMARLDELLYRKTREGKLLYVEGDQIEEINSLIKESHATQSFLSMGVRLRYRKGIQDNQLYKFMKAYANGQDSIVLKYQDAFHEDPIKELEEREKGHLRGLILSVRSEVDDEELI